MTETTEITFLVEPDDDGGYLARALGASIVTEADSKPALRDAVRDAVRCHWSGANVPRVIRLRFMRDEIIEA